MSQQARNWELFDRYCDSQEALFASEAAVLREREALGEITFDEVVEAQQELLQRIWSVAVAPPGGYPKEKRRRFFRTQKSEDGLQGGITVPILNRS